MEQIIKNPNIQVLIFLAIALVIVSMMIRHDNKYEHPHDPKEEERMTNHFDD